MRLICHIPACTVALLQLVTEPGGCSLSSSGVLKKEQLLPRQPRGRQMPLASMQAGPGLAARLHVCHRFRRPGGGSRRIRF